MIKTIGIVAAIILVLLALIILALKFINNLTNNAAEKAARKFCSDNNLQFVKIHALPNHYTIYYKKEGELYYSKFHFESDGDITWIKSLV
jgi:hypothetical protein